MYSFLAIVVCVWFILESNKIVIEQISVLKRRLFRLSVGRHTLSFEREKSPWQKSRHKTVHSNPQQSILLCHFIICSSIFFYVMLLVESLGRAQLSRRKMARYKQRLTSNYEAFAGLGKGFIKQVFSVHHVFCWDKTFAEPHESPILWRQTLFVSGLLSSRRLWAEAMTQT